jgi:hypothetical protein
MLNSVIVYWCSSGRDPQTSTGGLLEESKRLRADFTANRDRQIAQQFLRKRKESSDSDTALMVAIGKRHRVKRSAAIAAVKRGLKDLKA